MRLWVRGACWPMVPSPSLLPFPSCSQYHLYLHWLSGAHPFLPSVHYLSSCLCSALGYMFPFICSLPQNTQREETYAGFVDAHRNLGRNCWPLRMNVVCSEERHSLQMTMSPWAWGHDLRAGYLLNLIAHGRVLLVQVNWQYQFKGQTMLQVCVCNWVASHRENCILDSLGCLTAEICWFNDSQWVAWGKVH